MLKRLFNRQSSISGVPTASNRQSLNAVTVRVDDSPGWGTLTQLPHDYTYSETQDIYADALEAFRKNPIAWRIINITTDYVVGDNIKVSSPNRILNKFIYKFWNHPQNRMDLRLPTMSDELARAGDLFILLFINPQDGMSYVRFVTKDRIVKIETAENDWEKELIYHEKLELTTETRQWYSPEHPAAATAPAVMLHYAVNRPLGALLGDSDLVTMLPWLQRYSRMLEDRVRLHWAIRAFLWFVTVPTNAVSQKKEQYRTPPESGSIVVKDESEKWEVQTPALQAGDAQHDLKAVRQMIDAGSGYPPHWRGESGDANLATATAMQGPTERHLLRRQQYFTFIVQDLLYHAYNRCTAAGFARDLPTEDYDKLYHMIVPEVSRWDNEALANAARNMAAALQQASSVMQQPSDTLARWGMKVLSRFAGQPLDDETVETILTETRAAPPPAPTGPAMDPTAKNDVTRDTSKKDGAQ
jgi:hypothetical protein